MSAFVPPTRVERAFALLARADVEFGVGWNKFPPPTPEEIAGAERVIEAQGTKRQHEILRRWRTRRNS